MSDPIRRDEWLAELERALATTRPVNAQRPRGSFTAAEAEAATGRPHSSVNRLLNELHRAGRLICYGRLPSGEIGIDGRMKVVATYGLRPAPKPAKGRAA